MSTIRRPSWDERFMMDAIGAATRSSCLVRAVGVSIVMGKHNVACGYNGAPPGMESCLDTGVCDYQHMAYENSLKLNRPFDELKEEHKQYCKAIHAEKNGFNQCLARGVKLEDPRLYITNFPCPPCVRDVIIPNKVVEVVVWKDYLKNPLLDHDEYTVSMRRLHEAGIPVRKLDLSADRIMEIATLMTLVGNRLPYQYIPGMIPVRPA